jgi:hypothetical protein
LQQKQEALSKLVAAKGELFEYAGGIPTRTHASVRDFLTNVLGEFKNGSFPEAWRLPTATWDDLFNFDVSSNLGAFVEGAQLAELAKPQTLQQLVEMVSALKDGFCTPEG